MEFAVKTIVENATFDDLCRTWRAAEETGVFRTGWLNDHLLPVLGKSADPCLESWMTLSALACSTKHLRLGIMVSAMVYRHPALLAKMAATLDVISGGRLELGLGAGWAVGECAAYGIDLPSWGERFDRLEEGCHVIRTLLTQETSNFAGRFFTLVDAPVLPSRCSLTFR